MFKKFSICNKLTNKLNISKRISKCQGWYYQF